MLGLKLLLPNKVDNSRNVDRKTHGQRYTFVDDRGAWTTPSTSMPKTPYVADSAGTRRRVFVKGGKYCIEHNPSRKVHTYEELAPQPADSDVIVVRHYYNKLTAAPNDYQRRISWLEGGAVALVEYTDVFPGHCPHGNMTKNQGVYRRIDPDTLNAIGRQTGIKPAKQVFHQLDADCPPGNGSRHMNQVYWKMSAV
jgi:hypothetical protein